jgi:transposase
MAQKSFRVNARHTRNVPDRKSDISDAEWLQQIHSHGMARASFQPDPCAARPRPYFQQEDTLARCRSSHQQHIQKTLIRMDQEMHHAARDITASGPDPQKLAALRDRCCEESEAMIPAALDSNGQEEHLFGLTGAVEMLDVYSLQIQECDLADQSVCQATSKTEPPEPFRIDGANGNRRGAR